MALPSRLCSDRGSRGVAPLLIVADRSGDPSRLVQSQQIRRTCLLIVRIGRGLPVASILTTPQSQRQQPHGRHRNARVMVPHQYKCQPLVWKREQSLRRNGSQRFPQLERWFSTGYLQEFLRFPPRNCQDSHTFHRSGRVFHRTTPVFHRTYPQLFFFPLGCRKMQPLLEGSAEYFPKSAYIGPSLPFLNIYILKKIIIFKKSTSYGPLPGFKFKNLQKKASHTRTSPLNTMANSITGLQAYH